MTDERLLCHCPLPCSNRATQEDMLCDTCRPFRAAHFVGHGHIGGTGAPPGARKAPIPAGIGPVWTFEVRL